MDFALAAGAERLALFHHAPDHDDDAIERMIEVCQERVQRESGSDERALEVTAAAEGQSIELSEDSRFVLATQESEWEPEAIPSRPFSPAERARVAAEAVAETVLIAGTPENFALLTLKLEPEGLRLLTASSAEAVLQAVRRDEPDLVLLGATVDGLDPLQISRDIRAAGYSVPVVVLTRQVDSDTAAASFAAGVTDHLILPYTPAQVRSRVRRWLQRQKLSARAPQPLTPAGSR